MLLLKYTFEELFQKVFKILKMYWSDLMNIQTYPTTNE